MSDEATRKDILDLLSRGKINVDEAAELLAGEGDIASAETEPEPVKANLPTDALAVTKADVAANNKPPSWLKVRVRNLETGKNKVTVNVPIGMVQFGLRVAGKFTPEVNDVNLNEMSEMIATGASGTIVEVEDNDSNEQVLIYIE